MVYITRCSDGYIVYDINVYTYKHDSLHAFVCCSFVCYKSKLFLLVLLALMQLHLLLFYIGYMLPTVLCQFSRPNIQVLIDSQMIFVNRHYYS